MLVSMRIAILTAARWGVWSGLAVCGLQVLLLALGAILTSPAFASNILLGLAETPTILVISSMILFVFAWSGRKVVQQTGRKKLGVIAGFIAGVLTGLGVVAWTVVLQRVAPYAYQSLVGKGAPPFGLPYLDTVNVVISCSGYALVGAIVAFAGGWIASARVLPRTG